MIHDQKHGVDPGQIRDTMFFCGVSFYGLARHVEKANGGPER